MPGPVASAGSFPVLEEDAAIILNGLSKCFPGLSEPALEPLSLRISAGAVTGLVGPDGAGKSTLLRMLAGLLEPSGGTCGVAGLDPIRHNSDLHAILGYMPQRFGLYEDLTVLENLELYASLRNVRGAEKKAAFTRLLGFTGLGPFTNRLGGKLSGGMKQKLGLACTLLGQPKVLLLDEPGVGVDPISRRELWGMVHELAGSGMLVVWSTSYLDEAERCREVVLLDRGKLLYTGAPKGLTGRMAGRSFLIRPENADKRALQQRAVMLPEVSDAVIQGASLRVIVRETGVAPVLPEAGKPTLPAAHAPSLMPEFVAVSDHLIENVSEALNVPASCVTTAEPRFEDVFIDLLGGGPSRKSGLAAILDPIRPCAGEAVIQARDLTKAFGAFTATDHVNFEVRQGEIFGLLGPNGAGKSTTFRMLCGLLRPTSGQALVLGLDLQKHPGRVRQQLGYMAQKFSLYGGLSVEQNLSFFSGVYGLSGRDRQDRVDEMVETFSFGPILNRNADTLPLGFKQRLALACALMHRPSILFLDEPTSGVDPLTRREFWLHINSMVEKGVTVMVTTHFMEEAEYCDRIGLVYQGKLIASGTPDALKSRSQAPGMPEPGMEDAFITLIERYDAQKN